MPPSGKIAVVAALEREVQPLIKNWTISAKEYAGRQFRFFESDDCVVICGGIGGEAARRATEAVIALYKPKMIYSVGFAGALDSTHKVGQVLTPRWVIDAGDGSRVDTGSGEETLISFSSVADPEQKTRLRDSFAAQAVDMEAAAVARAAGARGVKFAAVKAISDESDFVLPATEKFVGPTGEFQSFRFALFVAARPWLWPATIQLARNSARASLALCDSLRRLMANPQMNVIESETVHHS